MSIAKSTCWKLTLTNKINQYTLHLLNRTQNSLWVQKILWTNIIYSQNMCQILVYLALASRICSRKIQNRAIFFFKKYQLLLNYSLILYMWNNIIYGKIKMSLPLICPKSSLHWTSLFNKNESRRNSSTQDNIN